MKPPTPETMTRTRVRLDLTREDVAAALRVDPVTVWRWETGKTRPHRRLLKAWVAFMATQGKGKA